ncbi:hypothetical protein N7489_003215 [Penicillium chrysogenum]|uniref:Proteasome assembly chaperone 3 n=1 Tax=Penicillium chrysogenum TaxID=5076 RepID=A0ABQ8W8I9_PENCH|nr:uncharacterized protein N7489_003215 [Penicillium chrysogenum]KAJ5252805.1 hypothetical protein N7489_003215 [Penicillium chrysogenum]KAJ5254044.1 hypothetical protein N7524_011224 [Penicillium chrysogenum]KAJ5260037.1 hypothetical protein N7505_009418 [Penicillium chrysogenum]
MTESFDTSSLQDSLNLPFPATTKQIAGLVNGVQTDVVIMSFSDKIMVTISQAGRLAHWLHVPMENQNPGTEGMHTLAEGEDALLPLKDLTTTTLLDTTGQLLARQIATAIAMKTPSEKRLLLVGLGLGKSTVDKDSFFAIVEMVLQCL